jgi:hypothetical protein
MKSSATRLAKAIAWAATSVALALLFAGFAVWIGQLTLDGAEKHRHEKDDFSKYGESAVGVVIDLKERLGSRGFRVVHPILQVVQPDGRSLVYEDRFIGIDSVWSIQELLSTWRNRQFEVICVWEDKKCMARHGNMYYGADNPTNFYMGIFVSVICVLLAIGFGWLTMIIFKSEFKRLSKDDDRSETNT